MWIVADEQTAGRGRHGRTWVSLTGNLHASALLIDPCPQARSPQLGFVAGVALARAAEDAGAKGRRLKWPNDLVASGAKCAGLLLEGAALPDRRLACVIGVGVNCATAPDGVGYPTAALRRADGQAIAAAELFERLAERFAETLDLWDAGDGFDAVRAEWLKHAHASARSSASRTRAAAARACSMELTLAGGSCFAAAAVSRRSRRRTSFYRRAATRRRRGRRARFARAGRSPG